jgi:hypothetical protein
MSKKIIDPKNMPKPELTEQQVQIMRDDQTVFALAVLMMDLHTGTLIKNKNMVANSFMKAGVVLRNNPGFPDRFKAAQDRVKAQMAKQGPLMPEATPLPTDTALDIVPPTVTKLESVPPSAPPPDEL